MVLSPTLTTRADYTESMDLRSAGPVVNNPGTGMESYTDQMGEADTVMTNDQLVEQLHSRTVYARGVIRYHTTRATCTNAWAVRQPY